jgi:CBS domain containing-hemolysin-like protein
MIGILLTTIVIFLILHAFFAGIETGVISIHRMRLRHFVRQGSKNAQILEGFIQNFDRLLGTTLVGTNICVVINSVAASAIAANLNIPAGGAVSSALTTILIVLFAEYIPKAWFRARPLERSERFAGLLRVSEIIFMPVSYLIIGLARLISPGEKQTFAKPQPFVTREDLKTLAKEGEKDGVLSSKERYMIHRVIELSGKKARDIMIPLEKITYAHDDMTIPQFYTIARQSGLTRMPVMKRETSEFVGIINVFHVLSDKKDQSSKIVGDYMRPAQFVPHDMPVDDILPRMRRGRQPMCLIRENMKVIGLVTTEDILRIIVGKL